jgi:hypothetical protein
MVLGIGSTVEGKVGNIKGKQGTITDTVGDGKKIEKKWIITWKDALVKSKNSSQQRTIPLSRINDDEYSDSIITFKETIDHENSYSSIELRELDIVQLVPKRKVSYISNNDSSNDNKNYSDSDSENDNGKFVKLSTKKISTTSTTSTTTTNTNTNTNTNINTAISTSLTLDNGPIKVKKFKPNNNDDDDEDDIIIGVGNMKKEKESRIMDVGYGSIYGRIHYQMPLSRTEYYSHCKGTNKRAKRRCSRAGCTEKTAFYCVICSKPDLEQFFCYCSNDVCFSEHVIEKYLTQQNSTKS